MDPLITITTERGGMYFSLFYILSFLVCISVILIIGLRKKYPTTQLLLIISSGVIFFILGNKMFAFSPEEWKNVFTDFRFDQSGEKTVLGGLIGLLFGVWFAKKILRFQLPVFDLVAVAVPLAMAVQRVGCLMAGCCYGKPTSLPWGIAYSEHSRVFHAHVDQLLIHVADQSSLSVHPTQAYQIIFCLIIAAIVWKTRKSWKAPGNQLLFSFLLYGIFRFFSEFFRDPAANGWAGQFLWGIKYAQWLILSGVIILTIVLIFKERYTKTKALNSQNEQGLTFRIALLAGLHIFILYAGHTFFNPIERLTMLFVMLPTLCFVGWYVYKKFIPEGTRWAIPVLTATILVLTSQTFIPKNPDEKVTFTEIGIAGMVSSYYQDISQYQGQYSDGCGGTINKWSDSKTMQYSNYQVGFEVSRHIVKSKYKRISFRTSAFFASDKVHDLMENKTYNEFTFAISPYLQTDWRSFGFGVGFQVGQFRFPNQDKQTSKMDLNEWENEANEFNFYPQFHIRGGPYDIAFVEFNLLSFFPSGTPMPYSMLGIGTGLGRVDGTKLSAGISDAGYYMQATYPLQEKYLLTGFLSHNFKSGYDTRFAVSFGFLYRFNFKTSPKGVKKERETYQY